jgi:hypothetical protein
MTTPPAPHEAVGEIEPSSADFRIPRVVSGIAGIGAGAFAFTRIGLEASIPMVGNVVLAGSTILALFLVWFALRGHRQATRNAIRTGCLVGTVTGALGLAGGFLGPILLSPDSPQGPLLGIFVTGPIGAMLGTVVGTLVGVVQNHER